MTAGSGILHDEMLTDELVMTGGYFHGIQLWANLPKRLKGTAPRYQDIRGDRLLLLTSHDGSSLIRLIAGSLGGHEGPGSTWTLIVLAHASVALGAQLHLPWNPAFSERAYALLGPGTADREGAPLAEGPWRCLDPGTPSRWRAGCGRASGARTWKDCCWGESPFGSPSPTGAICDEHARRDRSSVARGTRRGVRRGPLADPDGACPRIMASGRPTARSLLHRLRIPHLPRAVNYLNRHPDHVGVALLGV